MKKTLLFAIRAFHSMLIIYFLVAAPLAVLGILARWPLLNNITLILTGITVLSHLLFRCPLTAIEAWLIGKEPGVFTPRFFEKFGIRISKTGVGILWIIVFLMIIVSYFVY